MLTQFPKVAMKGLAIAAIVGILASMGVVAAFAQEPGFDPGSAGGPSANWVSINPGQDHWYAFRDEGDRESIEITLDVQPADRASFKVVTQDNLRRWADGEKLVGVGAGTQNASMDDKLFWTGSFVKGDTYYVLVEGDNFIASTYKLTISGKDVSFPTLAEPMMTEDVMASEMALTVEPAPAAAVESGMSAEMAMAPIGAYKQILPGQTQWYAFRDEGDQSQISINVDAVPDSGVTFEVWTPEQLRLWKAGETFDPVGAGTENTAIKADLFWSGSFIKGDTYYVVVKHSNLTNAPATYSLTVEGDDVSY